MPLRRPVSPAFKVQQRIPSRVETQSSVLRPAWKNWKLLLGLLVPLALFLAIYPDVWLRVFQQVEFRTTESTQSSAETIVPVEGDALRVAVCFFGLTRSLNHTIASIRENLLGPLSQRGYEVDVFVHTYSDISHLVNARTGEDTDLDTEQWRLLQPYDVSLTSQEEFLHLTERNMRRCLQRGTGWPREPLEMQVSNVRNLLAQLNSVFEVGKLWEKHYYERQYSAVMFARPDVQFSCPFPAHLLQGLQDETIYAPDFALWDGINDRFALLRPPAASVWKRRVFFTLHECRIRPIHAEIFASDFAKASGLSYLPIKRFGFVRVRSNGVTAALDAPFPDLCQGPSSAA